MRRGDVGVLVALLASAAHAHALAATRALAPPQRVPIRPARASTHMQAGADDAEFTDSEASAVRDLPTEAEFTDSEISAVMRDLPTDWEKRNAGTWETVEERRMRAINVLRTRALYDVDKQAQLLKDWRRESFYAVTSWYDTGVRLVPKVPPPPPVEVRLEPIEKPGLSASVQASLAAGLLSALAVVGIDIASFGVVENLDLALLVGGLALSQVDSATPLGTTLRVTGNVTSTVATEVVIPVAKTTSNFYVQNELGYKARAVLELGLEKAVEALNPKRRVADGLAAQYERLASEAAQLRAERDAVPFWQLQERWGLDDRVRAAEREALEARRAAQAAYAALGK